MMKCLAQNPLIKQKYERVTHPFLILGILAAAFQGATTAWLSLERLVYGPHLFVDPQPVRKQVQTKQKRKW